MNGAREYAALFRVEQHGKLYLVAGHHARGATFHIYIMPSEDRFSGMPWSHKDAVEVYGIVGGQPGWTEWYGWLHEGPWQADFAALVQKRKAEIADAAAARDAEKEANKKAALEHKQSLLAAYAK